MATGDGRVRLKIYKEDNELLSEFLVTTTTKGKDVVNRLQRHVHRGHCYLVEVWQGCERLVGDDENLLRTLLDWAEDVDEVRFHLRYKEQVPDNQLNSVAGPTVKRVNGFRQQVSPSSEVVLGGNRMTVDELRSLAARQQQEIALKEKELRAKDEQLKKLKQEERIRRSGNAPSKYLQELETQAELQDQRLQKLRQDQKEADKYSIRNIALAEELENVRQVFASKQSELAMAVARVECLTKQLEDRKKDLSSSPQSESRQASMSNEIGRLEKEMLTRNELNHQQSVQLLAQKQLLAEKHKELFDLDSQIDGLTNELQQKRSNGSGGSLDNFRNVSPVSHGSVTEDLDSDDLNFDEYDGTTNDSQWEINCDLLDIPPIELTSQENGVINGFHPSPTATQNRQYFNGGGSTNCQMTAPSSNDNKYIESGPSSPHFQHVRPRRLEALREEEEHVDDSNYNTDDNKTNNEIPTRGSTNYSRVARIKALFETESELNLSKDINAKKQLDMESKHVVGERVFGHLLQDFRMSDSAPSSEKDHRNAGGSNELDSPMLLERFDIDNFELSLGEEEDGYEEINSPVLQAKPNIGTTRPGPLKISPVFEVSPLSSPSSISSLSSFSSVASSTRVSAYSGVDQSQVHATRSLTSNDLQAQELLSHSTQSTLSNDSERQNWKGRPNVTQGTVIQVPTQNRIVKHGVTQVRAVQFSVTQASVTQANVTQSNKTLSQTVQPDMIQMRSVQPSARQAVVTQIRTIQPSETQTSRATPEKVLPGVTHVGSFQPPVTQGRTAKPGMTHSSATHSQLLSVLQSTCNERIVGASHTSRAPDKILDISSQPSAVNVKEQGSVPLVIVTEDINSYSGQSLPTSKHSGATFALVSTANGNGAQGSKAPSLPKGIATVYVKPPQHSTKPSTVVSSPSVKDLLSAFNNESRVSQKNYSKTNSNQEVKPRHVEGRESISKSESSYFYSSPPTGNVRIDNKTLESSSTKVVSTLKINLSGNKIKEKKPSVAAKPVSATEMKCSVDETLELPEQGKSWFQAQQSTLVGVYVPNSNDDRLFASRNSAKHPLTSKESDPNLRLDNTSFVSKPKGQQISNTMDTPSTDIKTAEQEDMKTDRNLSYSADGPAIGCRPGQQNKGKAAKHVSLDPHAVLLDASVEGELELVKSVIHNVDDPSQANSDGITALHNAVCGNHGDVVVFLVEFGCDINLPDSHGWTPLHCAAANNNLSVVQYLIDHGACIFATTLLQYKTPSQCCERTLPGYYACSKYLHDVEQNFGLVNDGVVYALYSYMADEKDELSFEYGEELHILRRGDNTEKEWWWAENSQGGHSGYVPRNLLGMYPRTAPEV